ncbi:MAG: glutamine amidotransferase [Acidobacteriota bacterium]|nr:glutamine amidotransferase [Acidobacteriota bacterium]
MPNRPLQALVLSHVAFEDLGSLQPRLQERGFAIETAVGSTTQFPLRQAGTCDLLVVLGGPIGVYDTRDYPFLNDEIQCIRQRLEACKPILGICLGAQLMAAALGARVYPGTRGAEIGWFPLRAPDGQKTPEWFAPLLAPGLRVFHWHGDTFDLPAGATRLAGSDLYDNQAFTTGGHALALQFHPEVRAADLEAWYVGHACELHTKGIDIEGLRRDAHRHWPTLEEAAHLFWDQWLNYIL